MSKKNTRQSNKSNGYSLSDRTVIYSHKKCLQPVPEVGKRFHCFDDGKIRFSRHYIVEITEVLGQMAFKKKYPEQFQQYLRRSKENYWLFSRSTDYFAICEHGENDKFGVFVRTKQGGWFGIGGWFNSGELDVKGQLWNELISNIDRFGFTDEEKKRLIEDNTI